MFRKVLLVALFSAFLFGSDFWETGVVEPDAILRDLIKIFHPELDTGWNLKYYMQLK